MSQESSRSYAGVETTTAAIVGLLEAMGAFEGIGRKILAAHGMKKIVPTDWVPLSVGIELYGVVATQLGENTLFDIGCRVPQSVPWPPEIKDIEAALRSIDVAYHMNHRLRGEVMFNPATGVMLEGIGHYRCERVSRRKILVTSDTPYPEAFECGIVTGTARKFEPTVEVEVDPNRTRSGGSRTFVVTW